MTSLPCPEPPPTDSYWSSYLPPPPDMTRYRPGVIVLDVGCGNGAQLTRLREAGHRAIGVELDPEAARTCRRTVPFISSGPLQCLERERHRRVKRHRVTAHGCLLDSIGLQSPPRDLDAALDIGTPGRWRRGADDLPQRLSGGS